MKCTMRDVARLAGVSVPTVSAVINRKGSVRPQLADRVRKAIEALDYHPNELARSLRMRRTRVIALIMPQIASPFFTEVLRGLEDAARARDYCTLIGDSSADAAEESRQVRALLTGQVDGLLLAPADPVLNLRALVQRRLPFVPFDRVPVGFEDDLMKVLVPLVDSTIRTIPDSDHRAMAGLSMGGMQAFQVALDHLDMFSYLGGFSGAPFFLGNNRFDPKTASNGVFCRSRRICQANAPALARRGDA